MSTNSDFQPSAKVITHSITWSPQRSRELITFSGTFHRYILSEFNTHRCFSRNSASSRAIPVSKMLDLAANANVYPVEWSQNMKGMSAEAQVPDPIKRTSRVLWDDARNNAIVSARIMSDLEIHKQVTNRLLEPFLPHAVVFTCDYKGLQSFLALRDSPYAQPEIREFAKAVKNAYNDSAPTKLFPGEVHLPFVDKIYQWEELFNLQTITDSSGEYQDDEFMYSPPIYESVATCARYSYLGHEKDQTPESNEKLFWSLFQNHHLSPFEHVAVALTPNDTTAKLFRRKILGVAAKPSQNYTGAFMQLRKVLEKDHK